MKPKILLLSILCCWSLCALKIPDADSDDLMAKTNIMVEKYRLDNGLTVLLSVDRSSPEVAINIWYQVGAVNEQPHKTGLAHLFEHLMFEGSRQIEGAKHFKTLESTGASGINATTSLFRTNYFETMPKDSLELALSLESSRMFFLALTQAKLDEQREVVRREREQRYETTPYGLAALKLWQNIFGPDHPFHGKVIGSHEDLVNATLTDVQGFYDHFYGPSNASLALVGDFDPNEAKALIDKYFSTMPPTTIAIEPPLPAIELKGQEVIRVDEKLGQLPLVRIQYLTPGLFEKGDAELDIISDILAGGEYGRLQKALTRDQHWANFVSARQESFSQVSVFTIDVILNQGVKEDLVIDKIDEVLADLVSNPPTDMELERAKNSIMTNVFFSLEKKSNRADLLQSYNRFAKDPSYIKQDIERYVQATPASLKASVVRYLPPGEKRKVLIAKNAPIDMALKGK